jgi:hypothetical protein
MVVCTVLGLELDVGKRLVSVLGTGTSNKTKQTHTHQPTKIPGTLNPETANTTTHHNPPHSHCPRSEQKATRIQKETHQIAPLYDQHKSRPDPRYTHKVGKDLNCHNSG